MKRAVRRDFLRLILSLALAFEFSIGSESYADNEAFYSIQGTVGVSAGATVDYFDFAPPTAGGATIRTLHQSGGINEAGVIVPSGGFDPFLRLYQLAYASNPLPDETQIAA